GNLSAYREAQSDVLAGRMKTRIPGEQVRKDLWLDRAVDVHPTVSLDGRIVIRSGSIVGRGAALSGDLTVGSGCQIRAGATVRRGVLFPGAVVGEEAHLEDCIVGPGYRVRPGERISGGTLVCPTHRSPRLPHTPARTMPAPALYAVPRIDIS
ncbi:hypothetical protein, partial [Rubrobacter taiwanensis]|uniref:hypothetical protein n=1 Tax=Rubrobacter taiwanensis TaxID=185139 RepID=UPI001A9E301A